MGEPRRHQTFPEHEFGEREFEEREERAAQNAHEALARDSSVTRARVATNQVIVEELIKVLLPQPNGLRRWSVMRALRNERARTARDIPQKFEDDVERVFRRLCEGMPESKDASKDSAKTREPSEMPLFYRPAEKAGEVWAVYPDRAKAWLAGERS